MNTAPASYSPELHGDEGHRALKQCVVLKGKTLAALTVTVGAERGPALWAFIEEVGV